MKIESRERAVFTFYLRLVNRSYVLKCINSYLVLYAGSVSTIILFEFKRHIILSGCRLKFKLDHELFLMLISSHSHFDGIRLRVC